VEHLKGNAENVSLDRKAFKPSVWSVRDEERSFIALAPQERDKPNISNGSSKWPAL